MKFLKDFIENFMEEILDESSNNLYNRNPLNNAWREETVMHFWRSHWKNSWGSTSWIIPVKIRRGTNSRKFLPARIPKGFLGSSITVKILFLEGFWKEYLEEFSIGVQGYIIKRFIKKSSEKSPEKSFKEFLECF